MKKYQDGGQGKESSKSRAGIGGRTIVKSKLSYADDSRNYDRKTREVTKKDGSEKTRTKTTVRPAGEKAETTVRKFTSSGISGMTSRPGMIPVKKGIMKMGGAKMKKYANGGEGDDPVTPTKSTSATSATKSASQLGSMTGKQYRQEKKGIKRAQKLERIATGKQGDRVDNVIKAVGAGAEAVANVAGAVGKTREAFGPNKKMGGSVKKMQNGGRVISEKAAARKSAKGKGFVSSVMGPNPSGDKGKYVPFTRAGRKDAKEKGMVSSNEMKPSRKIMKTGGMVNSNTKATVSKVASGRPVKSAEPKTAAKRATGRVGGISKAPRAAAPKMKMGGSMKRK